MMPIDAKARLIEAIEALLVADAGLLKRDLNERTLTHRLALYLDPLFKEVEGQSWDVDCEYNRNLYSAKRLQIPGRRGPNQTDDEDDKGTTVYPDIIVHKRELNSHNLLVIEAKKNTSPADHHFDYAKLAAFRNHPFSYQVA
ncbi:MAG: hypothetical protein ABSC94_31770, partial [Polyangiaceae bacterium]